MELKDTIELMQSDDYKERFRAEYFQLKIRADKLSAFLVKYANGELDFTPSCSYDCLYEQYVYMKNYQHQLEVRARCESIDLTTE